MYRGTTPTITFKFDEFDLSIFETVYVTFKQHEVTIEKTGSDISYIDSHSISVTLTQEDTLSLDDGNVKVQVRMVDSNGKAVASEIVSTTVHAILKDGVI